MNLKELIALIKKAYVYLILGAVGIFIVALIYVYFDNPKGDQGFGKLPYIGIKSLIASKIKVNSTLSNSNNPPRLANVFKLTTEEVKAETLASKLGVVGKPTTTSAGSIWVSLANSFSVESQTSFVFIDNLPVGPKSVTEEQALRVAKGKIKSLGLLENDISLENLKTSYVVFGRNHQEVVTKNENFSVFAFEFGVKLDQISLVDSSGSTTLYSVFVGVDGKVKRIQGVLKKLAFTEKSTYPVKHLSTEKEDVAKGLVKIVSTNNRIESITEINVNYVTSQLVYLIKDQKQTFLQPVFLLLATTGFTETIKETGILEALKDESYK